MNVEFLTTLGAVVAQGAIMWYRLGQVAGRCRGCQAQMTSIEARLNESEKRKITLMAGGADERDHH